jgi:hypothetical protein
VVKNRGVIGKKGIFLLLNWGVVMSRGVRVNASDDYW